MANGNTIAEDQGQPQPALNPQPVETQPAPPVFVPLKPKNPDSESQVALINKYNSFIKDGGTNSDLSYQDTQDVLAAADGLNPRVTEEDALSNPDTYFNQVYKAGKSPKLLSQTAQTGEFWANLIPNIIGGAAGLVKDVAIGSVQKLGDEAQAYNPFLTQQERSEHAARLNIATVGAFKNATIMPLRLINGVNDIARKSNLDNQLADPNLTPEQRDKLERQESELFRERQLREKLFNDQVEGANKDLAGIYRTVGLVDQAHVVMTDKAQPTPEEKVLAQTVQDPTNLLTEGVSAIVGKGGGLFMKAGVRTLPFDDAIKALNAAETDVTALAARRTALEARIESLKSAGTLDTRELETTLARQVPEERKAANSVVEAKGRAGELGKAVKDQMDGMVPGNIIRRLTGNSFGALGNAVDAVASGMEKFKGISDSAAGRIAGPGADPAVTEAVGQQLNRMGTDALKGVVSGATQHVGRAVGQTIGGAVGGVPGAMIGGTIADASRALVKIIINPDNMRALGRDFKMVGRQLSLGRQTLPFWKSVSEKTTGLPSWIASKLDVPLIYSIPDVARGTVAGMGTGAALGFLSSGGESDPTVQGAASGVAFGLAGAGLGQVGKFNSPATLHAARIGDRARFMATLAQNDRPMFNRLRPDEQLAIGVYAMAHPDLHLKFFDDPKGTNGTHGVDDRGAVASLNVSGDNPLKAILEHEIAHHIASHDLSHVVTDYMVGNVLKGEPGIFTQYDDDGKPVLYLDPDTKKMSYMTDERFDKYVSQYNARKARDLPGEPPDGTHGIAQEMFAELHAAAFKDPVAIQKLVRGFVPSDLVSGNALSNWFGKVGMAYDPITGSVVHGAEIDKVRGLSDLVARYYKDRAWKNHPMEHEDGLTRINSETWRADPETIYRNLDGAGILTRDPKTGDIVKGTDGLPIIKTSAQSDKDLAAMTKDVVDYLRANPRVEGQMGDNVLKLVTDRDGRQFYRGQTVPQEVLDHVANLNAHNPWQIQNWRKLNDIMTRNDGTMTLINYNTPQKGGRYASLAMKERAVVPVWTEVSPNTGQVSIKAYDPEQMAKHVTKMVRRPAAQSLWGGKVQPALEDVHTYLTNLAEGRPGEADIGLSKKAMLNEIFGFPAGGNPSIADIAKRPTNQSVLKNFRLDRINRIRETRGVAVPFHEATYEQVRSYAQPRLAQAQKEPVKTTSTQREPFAHLPDEALPKLSDPTHTKHLAPGTHFLDPKGVRRKVPHG